MATFLISGFINIFYVCSTESISLFVLLFRSVRIVPFVGDFDLVLVDFPGLWIFSSGPIGKVDGDRMNDDCCFDYLYLLWFDASSVGGGG